MGGIILLFLLGVVLEAADAALGKIAAIALTVFLLAYLFS